MVGANEILCGGISEGEGGGRRGGRRGREGGEGEEEQEKREGGEGLGGREGRGEGGGGRKTFLGSQGQAKSHPCWRLRGHLWLSPGRGVGALWLPPLVPTCLPSAPPLPRGPSLRPQTLDTGGTPQGLSCVVGRRPRPGPQCPGERVPGLARLPRPGLWVGRGPPDSGLRPPLPPTQEATPWQPRDPSRLPASCVETMPGGRSPVQLPVCWEQIWGQAQPQGSGTQRQGLHPRAQTPLGGGAGSEQGPCTPRWQGGQTRP